LNHDPGSGKRVLMISFAFFSRPGAGHVRSQKFAKYLPLFGWEPTILTARLRGEPELRCSVVDEVGEVRVVEASFHDPFMATKEILGLERSRDALAQVEESMGVSPRSMARARIMKRIVRLAKDWVAFPDARITWAPAAVVAGYQELWRGRYSAIYSTSPPATNHIVACVLKRLFGLPWVADFRDLWSQDEFLDRSTRRRKIERFLERSVIRSADYLVTVNSPYARTLREIHDDKPIAVITNGFDPDDHAIEADPVRERLVITYTGNLYGLRCDPRPVISALERLIDRDELSENDVRLRIYSQWDPAFSELKNGMRYKEILEVYDMVSRDDALKRQKESTALLAILFDEPQASSCHSSKVFEYMGAGRPILLWAPRGGIAEDLLTETHTGRFARTDEELGKILLEWAREFKETGEIACQPLEEEVCRYSRRELTRELAAIMDGAVADSMR